jgi:hypothetical protein
MNVAARAGLRMSFAIVCVTLLAEVPSLRSGPVDGARASGGSRHEAQMATWVKQAAALPGWVP